MFIWNGVPQGISLNLLFYTQECTTRGNSNSQITAFLKSYMSQQLRMVVIMDPCFYQRKTVEAVYTTDTKPGQPNTTNLMDLSQGYKRILLKWGDLKEAFLQHIPDINFPTYSVGCNGSKDSIWILRYVEVACYDLRLHALELHFYQHATNTLLFEEPLQMPWETGQHFIPRKACFMILHQCSDFKATFCFP